MEIFRDAGRIKDVGGVLEATQRHEDLGRTGLDLGIAVPHAKTDRVDRLTVVIGISKNGIGFDALDGKSSHLFFLSLRRRIKPVPTSRLRPESPGSQDQGSFTSPDRQMKT